MDLGYQFDPLPVAEHSGCSSLSVRIACEPTLRHFDPEVVRTRIISDEDLLATLMISHPWIGLPLYTYSADLIRISDRKNNIVDAFSLGGRLTITSQDTHTCLEFISTAPIFPKIEPDQESFHIATQIEGLLAERRAIWAFDLEEFQRRLADLKPEDLYWLCIQELQQRFSAREKINHTTEILSTFFFAEYQRLLLPGPVRLITGTLSDYI